jgi:crotonobetainyl-CoA:carnitine CoA-transferase CaiB-like acyl-CoA transferase
MKAGGGPDGAPADSLDPPPLEGIKVLELAQMVAGPAAGLLLADYGAEVIKIEPPEGDGCRQLRSAEAAALPDSPVFVAYNRNKTVTRLDLRAPTARDQVLALADEADVLIESSRPGAMERLGLGPEVVLARNPRIIYASVSGFGWGPAGRSMGGVDIIVQAESGIMSTTGQPDQPPTKVGFTVVDAACGHALCHGILAALLRRGRTGRGGQVQISLYDVALNLQTGPLTEFAMTGVQSPRSGNSAPLTAPAGLFRCSDGSIVVSAYLPRHWVAFTDALGAAGLRDDPRFENGVTRARHRDALTALIEDRLATRPADEWVRRLRQARVLVARARDYAAVAEAPLARETGMLLSEGELHGVGSPVRLGRTEPPAAWPRAEVTAQRATFSSA